MLINLKALITIMLLSISTIASAGIIQYHGEMTAETGNNRLSFDFWIEESDFVGLDNVIGLSDAHSFVDFVVTYENLNDPSYNNTISLLSPTFGSSFFGCCIGTNFTFTLGDTYSSLYSTTPTSYDSAMNVEGVFDWGVSNFNGLSITQDLYSRNSVYDGDFLLDQFYLTSLAQVQVQVPEPSTVAIFGIALLGLVTRRYKK